MKVVSKISLIIFLMISTLGGYAQHKLISDQSMVYIDGTSSLHDWTETVETITGTLNAEIADGKLVKISGVKCVMPVKSISSGKSGMDDNTYKALKAKAHPNISYSLKSYAIAGDMVHLTGNLTIAGVTKEVKFYSKYTIENGKIKFDGSHKFKMTEFNVQPPTAMMGTIKTGDEVEIRFNLVFEINKD